jgi:hypothetical protein
MKMVKHLFVTLFLIIVLLNTVGCASGVKYAEYESSIPDISAEQSRLYIYRVSTLGAVIQPEVRVDNFAVCKAVPEGFVFKDVRPGSHKVQCSTEVSRALSLTLKPGQTKYVRLDVSMGFLIGHISPKLIEEEVALKELQKCRYIGE